MSSKETGVFNILNAIDVGNHIEQKNGLSYLSWAWAWSTVKSIFPKTTYKVYENEQGLNYHHDGKTAWVKVGVTIEDECIEYLPVMDFKNKSIPLSALTSMDVNKAIQRALTKAIARQGLGLYVYAGEDLPESAKYLNEDQTLELESLIAKTGTDKTTLLQYYKVRDLKEVDYNHCLAMLNKKLNVDHK